MQYKEIIVVIYALLWIVSFYVERSAGKNMAYGRYAWLAYGAKPMLFFGGIGFFLIFVGTDWRNPFWERNIGLICIIIGIGLFGKAVFYRKKIQAGLESGQIKPSEEA